MTMPVSESYFLSHSFFVISHVRYANPRAENDVKVTLTSPGVLTGLSSDRAHCPTATIELEAVAVDGGGQGEIFRVLRTDSRSVADVVAKVFSDGFPDTLLDTLRTVRTDTQLNIASRAALQGLPLFAFDGVVAGRGRVNGYLMRRVPGQSFSSIVDNHHSEYVQLPLASRLTIASHFVDGMSALYALTIVHADLNGQNLLVDMRRCGLNIIDIDGGAVARNEQVPVVCGKPEPGWLAPEVWRQFGKSASQRQVTVALTADLWSIACGVHHLLFGVAPFFFMDAYSAIPSYLHRYKWPQLTGLGAIGTRNAFYFGRYQQMLGEVPDLLALFRRCFQDGFEVPAQRLSPSHWEHAITGELKRRGLPVPRPVIHAAARDQGKTVAARRQKPSPHEPAPTVASPGHSTSPRSPKPVAGPNVAPSPVLVPTISIGSLSLVGAILVFAVVAASLFNAGRPLSVVATPPETDITGPQPSQTVEVLIRQRPSDVELWNRALLEWQQQPRRAGDAILGTIGIMMLLQHQPSGVTDDCVSAALNDVGKLPQSFYRDLSAAAESTVDTRTAVAILNAGVAPWPD